MSHAHPLIDILGDAGIPVPVGLSRALEISGVVCDSRLVRAGYLFVAVAGTREDGSRYAADALKRGAVAVVAEHGLFGLGAVPVLVVASAREALGRLAAAFHGHPSQALRMVGITGTNGKTTSAFMVAHILRGAGWPTGVLGTVEYQVGERVIPAPRTTPDAATLHGLLAQMVAAGSRSAVMEVSSHALMQHRTEGVFFDVAAFTNLTQDHLDYHGDMNGYFAAKAELFTQGRCKRAVICIDDAWGRELVAQLTPEMEVWGFGEGRDADVRVVEAAYCTDHWQVALTSPWGDGACIVPMAGRYNVSNALCAIACAVGVGIDFTVACECLASFPGVAGRMERVPNALGRHVLVDYAHTDDALGNVLGALRETAAGRVIVVFGCGGDRDRAKRPAMGRVAAQFADVVVVTTDNPRSEPPAGIIDEVCAGIPAGAEVIREEDRRAAIGRALALSRPGDTVLIAGKGHERYQEFSDHTAAFDDVAVAREQIDGMV